MDNAQVHKFNKSKFFLSLISFVLIFCVFATVLVIPASATDTDDDDTSKGFWIRGYDNTAFSFSLANQLLYGPYYGAIDGVGGNVSARLWFVDTAKNNITSFDSCKGNFISIQKNEKITFRLHLEINGSSFSNQQDWSNKVSISAYSGSTLFSLGTVDLQHHESRTISSDPIVNGPNIIETMDFQVSFVNTSDSVASINSLHLNITGVNGIYVRKGSISAIRSEAVEYSTLQTLRNFFASAASFFSNLSQRALDTISALNPLSFLDPIYVSIKAINTVTTDIGHAFSGEWEQTFFGRIVTDIKAIFNGNFDQTRLGQVIIAIKTGVNNLTSFFNGDITFESIMTDVISSITGSNNALSPFIQVSSVVDIASNLSSTIQYLTSQTPNNYTNVLYSSPNWR